MWLQLTYRYRNYFFLSRRNIAQLSSSREPGVDHNPINTWRQGRRLEWKREIKNFYSWHCYDIFFFSTLTLAEVYISIRNHTKTYFSSHPRYANFCSASTLVAFGSYFCIFYINFILNLNFPQSFFCLTFPLHFPSFYFRRFHFFPPYLSSFFVFHILGLWCWCWLLTLDQESTSYSVYWFCRKPPFFERGLIRKN